jgi:hypothetical protein
VAADPQPMVAVAAAPRPGCTVAVVPRSGVVAKIHKSVVATPRSRGRAMAGPLCGQAAACLGPRGGGTPKAGEQVALPDVRVATTPHEARGLRGVTEGVRCAQRRSRVTSSDTAQFGLPE